MHIFHLKCHKLPDVVLTNNFIQKKKSHLNCSEIAEELCDKIVCKVWACFQFETRLENDFSDISSGLKYFVNVS